MLGFLLVLYTDFGCKMHRFLAKRVLVYFRRPVTFIFKVNSRRKVKIDVTTVFPMVIFVLESVVRFWISLLISAF